MELKVGQPVKFVDTKRRTRDALVTCLHLGSERDVESFRGTYGQYPCINIVAVVCDEDRKDPYVQQTDHASSVQFKNPSADVAGGYFYFVP